MAACLLALCGPLGAEFVPPTRAEREAAAGPLAGLDAPLRRAFTDGGEFRAKRGPAAADWLAAHEEPGQTFSQYRASRPNVPDDRRSKLQILPLGAFEKGKAPGIPLLRDYMAAYFCPMTVEVLPPVAAGEVPAQSRRNSFSGAMQWKTGDILEWMRGRLPADSYAMIAVTMTDLYPDESWNFVFGQASIRQRVGVFSFARYHPAWAGEPVGDGVDTLVLKRAAKVLSHETGHMFGLLHCVHYECNMNGANHLQEADATPMHLCPVCLRKLCHATRCDPAARYGRLLKFYRANGLEEEAAWVEKRKSAIERAR